MGLVTAEDGAVINSIGGVLHFTGIAWAGGAGDPVPAAPRAGRGPLRLRRLPRDPARDAGGASAASASYFLYHEDVDVSLRLRLEGGRLGIEPAAVVDHDYEFRAPGQVPLPAERNRWATVLRDYPGPVLAVCAPACC